MVKPIDNEVYKKGTFNIEINTESLPKGDYFIRFLTNSKKVYQKLTI